MVKVPMKWVDLNWNNSGEGDYLELTDAEILKYGDQNRLDTCVVHTLNDVYYVLIMYPYVIDV